MTQRPPLCIRPPLTAQAGLTLVELMVALVIGLVVVLAASTALVVSRNGFNNIDAAAQLRDNARFAEDVLQRLGVQAGFEDLINVATPAQSNVKALAGSATNVPNVFVYGFNNRARNDTQGWSEANAGGRAAGSVGFGSDILVLRFQTNPSSIDPSKSDGAVIDCSGSSPGLPPMDRYDRVTSVLHVRISPTDNEPTLMCTRWADSGAIDTQPLIRGVENFQVLYGVDGIAAGNSTLPPAATADSVPERYLRADQLTVTDPAVTVANWQRVRSIRIGMVIRAAANSAVDRTTQTFYPLGIAARSGGSPGSMFADAANDPGTVFTPAPDGRLRQVVTFTVHLRNTQGDT